MAKINPVNNGDTGLTARQKINTSMESVETSGAVSGSGNVGDPIIVTAIPAGGLTGQVLKKLSNGDYDTDWQEESGGSSSSLQISTGILYGGEISINSGDNTTFDVAAGRAIFVDAYTDDENPVILVVDFPAQVAIPVTNIGTQLITFVKLNSSGSFLQTPVANNDEENRELIEIGVLVHEDLAIISKASTLANWVQDTDLKILDLTGALGRVSIEGNVYSPNGSNVRINKSEGKIFAINSNRAQNRKDPNVIFSPLETEINFLHVYINGGTQIVRTQDVDTNNYNPNGSGGLVAMPSDSCTTHGIFFTPETGLTVVHYGQFLYDSLRQAVDSWEKEEYNIAPELGGVTLLGVLAFVAGATDLSDPLQAKFIKPGSLGFKTSSRVPEYSRYTSLGDTFSGLTYKRADYEVIESGGSIFIEVERLGGGNMFYVFGERIYILDCTTGTGTGGKAQIELIQGSATAPQKNWVYVTPVPGNGDAQLNVSTSRPTGEFSVVADLLVTDSATFLTEGLYQNRRWSDAREFDGRSAVARTNERLRVLPAQWDNGVAQTVTIDTVPAPDSVDIAVTGGQVWQKHLQTFPALSVLADGIYIANHPTTPFLKITDLNDTEALQQADGTSLSGRRFNWVIWGAQNKTTGDCKLYLNLPVDDYGSNDDAIADPNNTAVTNIPPDFRGVGFLIARMPMRHRTGGGGQYNNLASDVLGQQVIDLRGQLANVTGGAVSVPATNTFEDVLFNIFNQASGFNFRFDASTLTANRVLTAPDSDGVLALLGLIQNWLADQKFDAGITIDEAGSGSSVNGLKFGDGDTGIYEALDDQLYINIAGTGRWFLTGNNFSGFTSNAPALANSNATAINPNIRPNRSDGDTGIGSAGADQLSLIAGGVESVRVEANKLTVSPSAVGAGTGLYFDDGDTGIYELSSNVLFIKINNSDAYRIDSGAIRTSQSQGFRLVNTTPSGTTPNICPNNSDPNSGIGTAGSDIVSIIGGSREGLRVTQGQVTPGNGVITFNAITTFDFNQGNVQEMVISANLTSWTISNELPAGSYTLYLIQDATGGWTIPNPTGIDAQGNNSLTTFDTDADAINIVNIFVTPSGTSIWSLVETVNP